MKRRGIQRLSVRLESALRGAHLHLLSLRMLLSFGEPAPTRSAVWAMDTASPQLPFIAADLTAGPAAPLSFETQICFLASSEHLFTSEAATSTLPPLAALAQASHESP